jgi:uncharacterized membrane protein
MLAHFRRYLIAGLLVWVPLGVTMLVIKLFVDLLDRMQFFVPPAWRPEELFGFSIPGLGIVVGMVLVLSTGAVAVNLIGRRLVISWEAFLARIPFVRTVYTSVKQVMVTLLSTRNESFRRVLLVEFPRRGIWRLGFQTGLTSQELKEKLKDGLITVFVPSSPNPTSGFVIFVPKEETIDLDMPVDEAMKLLMSLGVLVPNVAAAQPLSSASEGY